MHNWFGAWEEDYIKHLALIIFKITDFTSIKPESVLYQGAQMRTKCMCLMPNKLLKS